MTDRHISDNAVQKHSGEKQLAGVRSAAIDAYAPGERGHQGQGGGHHTSDTHGLSKGHVDKDGSITFAPHDGHLTRGVGGGSNDKTASSTNHPTDKPATQPTESQKSTPENSTNAQKDGTRSVTTDADGTRHISQFNKDGSVHGSEVRRPDGSGSAHSVDDKGNTTDSTWNKDGSGSVIKKDAKGNPIESSSTASDGSRQEDKFDSKGTRTSERFDPDGRKTNSEVASKDGVSINSKFNKDGSVDTNRSEGNRVTDSEHRDGKVSINTHYNQDGSRNTNRFENGKITDSENVRANTSINTHYNQDGSRDTNRFENGKITDSENVRGNVSLNTHFNQDGTKNTNRFENGKITNSELKRPDGSSVNTAYDANGAVTSLRHFNAKGELQ